jgi:2-polyprenyl-6-methoxyphenol hydroxylase-like FAD-dependent oxidoreductase
VTAVVVGGGVGGLATALALARAGHPVTLLERDPLPPTADVEAAFAAERRGAPQVHQTHGFLARVVVELRNRFPDVLEQLLAAGCITLPTTANLGEPQPGDEDLRVLIVRRTTFEWVLRTAVLAEPGVDVRTGVVVDGLVARDGTPPVVTGVRLQDGTVVDADVVVSAGGRRAPVPTWLEAIGVDVPETVHTSGLVYVSRWYHLPPGIDITKEPKLGGDLQFVKFLAVPGDGDTLSITLAVPSADGELRSALSDEARFDLACSILPGPDVFFRGGPPDPIGGVRPMGGLLNRIRRFVGDDGPVVAGFHAVGDAHTCTNPLYGRGCSLAVVMAGLLADAVAAHPDDPLARAAAYEAACAAEVEPWFEVSLQMDRMGADPNGLGVGGEPSEDGPGRGMAAVMVAAQTDPIIGRGMSRFWNLLAKPLDLLADGALMARMAEVMADPDAWPLPPREGPTREELLEALADEREEAVS